MAATMTSGIGGTGGSVEERVKELEERMEGKVTHHTWDAKTKTEDVKEENMNNRVTRVEERVKVVEEGSGEVNKAVNEWG